MKLEPLRELGLSEGEIKVYVTLLRTGSCSVTKLAEVSGLHRTNIYDTLEKLREKGLVSGFLQKGKKYFTAAEPDNLLNYVDEKREGIKEILPELKKFQGQHEDVEVEMFKGEEGIKTMLKDIVREKKEVKIMGRGGTLRQEMPVFAKQYLRDVNKNRIKHKLLFSRTYDKENQFLETKFLPKSFDNPVETMIYGDKVGFALVGKEKVGVLLKSSYFVKAFENYFNLLWNETIRAYPGKDGVAYVLMELLEGNGKVVTGYGHGMGMRATVTGEFSDNWHSVRREKGIKLRNIMNDSKTTREYQKKRGKKWQDLNVRYLPAFINGPHTVFVCGCKMGIFFYSGKEPKAILIEDKDTIGIYEKHFEELWKRAKD